MMGYFRQGVGRLEIGDKLLWQNEEIRNLGFYTLSNSVNSLILLLYVFGLINENSNKNMIIKDYIDVVNSS